MRSLKTILPLLLVFSTLSTFAQRKDVGGELSVGPRLGGTLSASFKKHNNYNKSALELLLQFKDFNNVEDNDLDGFGVSLLWEKLAPLSGTSQLSAMIGGGPAFNLRLKMAPITLQLDWMPTYYFVNISTFSATNAAFTARYVLNRRRYKK
jgi:hypothetical protein